MSDSGNGTRRYLNRELSRLDFEERVLELAEDRSLPLLERAKFLAIFASNLDEFYMVRVAGLKRQRAAGLSSRSADGLTPKQQLELISEKVRPLVQRHAHAFVDEILPSLEKAGSRVLRWDDLDKVQRKELGELFYEKIFPIITPLAVDPAHPFPYISNLSLNLAAMVRDPSTGNTHFARIKVPPLLPRFIALRDQAGFVPLEDVISSNLDRLFPGMEVLEHHAFRVTRNADLEVNDDGAEDLLEALEEELRRQRFSPAVRLEIEASMAPHILELLMRELEVTEEDVHSLVGPIDLGGLSELYGIDRPELKDEPFVPGTVPELAVADEERPDLFAILRRHDVLLHHPYDSFTTSVQAFIEQAAADPDVLAIKQTLYRTSGDSPIVDTLMEAAEAGKQVMVLVEIKARGDERNNINWAKALERSGCHVVYGLVGLKTHCKLCLVVRQEGERLRRYVHLGTGNYNTVTARLYEDLGLLTADPMLGADVTDLFNSLTGYSRQTDYRSLVVAPHGMRERIISMIRREIDLHSADAPGRIVLKLNHLVDEDIIDALYEASQAGVRVDLVVRTNCALRPGVSGTSENIEVRSILGRFLEHSRIIYFHNGGDEEFYIGSADMMHRNLDRRVEALVRVEAPEITNRLRSILRLALTDNFSTWILDSGGAWKRLSPADGEERVVMQEELMQLAGKRP